MKKCFIGLGGIGCTTIKEHHDQCGNMDVGFYVYFDSDENVEEIATDSNELAFLFPGYPEGTMCLRSRGKDAFRYAIYTDKISPFFDGLLSRSFFIEDEIDITIVTTTFGGFGSGVVFEFIDYFNARKNIINNDIRFRIKIIAITHENYRNLFPENLLSVYEFNTIDVVQEYSYRSQKKSTIFPKYELFAVYNENYKLNESQSEWLCKVLSYTSDQLALINKANNYKLASVIRDNKLAATKEDMVFISCSSKDYEIAEKLVAELKKHKLRYWFAPDSIGAGSYAKQIIDGINKSQIFVVIISENSIVSAHVRSEVDRAFNRLKDGLKIMPFIVDNSKLSEDLEYYLCWQECFIGNTPPIESRIISFADKIKEVVAI